MTDIFSLICKPGHIHNLRSFFTCKTILCYIQENYSLNQFQKDIHLFFNAAAAVCNVELDLLVKKTQRNCATYTNAERNDDGRVCSR